MPIIIPTTITGLELRTLQVEDAQVMFKLIDSCRAYLSRYGEPIARNAVTIEQVADLIRVPDNRSRSRFALWHGHTFVGETTLTLGYSPTRVLLSYWVGERFSGRGYATAAARAASRYALVTQGFGEVGAAIQPHNTYSRKVLESAGFKRDGRYKDLTEIVYIRKR